MATLIVPSDVERLTEIANERGVSKISLVGKKPASRRVTEIGGEPIGHPIAYGAYEMQIYSDPDVANRTYAVIYYQFPSN